MAKIKRRFGCQIGCHPQTTPMISDPEFFRNFGFQFEIEPVKPDFFIEETPARKFLGLEMQGAGDTRSLSWKPVFLFP